MGRPNILQHRQGYNTDNSLHVNRNNVFLNEKEPFPQISKVVRRINLLFLHFCKSLVSEKTGLKLNIQKMRIMASGPITSWQIDGKQWKQWLTLFWGAPKSLQMVIAAMKLKDAYSLEGKL